MSVKDDYPLFLQTGKVTWTDSHSAPDPADREFPLWQTPLQPIWNYLDTRRKFGEIAEIHKGTEYKMGRIDTCVSAEEREGFVEGIWEVRNFLEPFTLRDSQYLSLNKEEMRDNAYLLPWGKPKILVNNIRSSRRYWRMEGVVDELGLMAGRNYHGIWATGNAPLELIAALINSPMGNAFLFDKSSGRDNYHKWIKQIPVPHFTSEQTELIVYLVQSYATKRQEWIAEPRLAPDWEPMCRDLLYQIDAAVIEAYELPADLETLLLSQFTETRRGGLPFKFPGYGEEYTNAQERNRRELAFRRTLKRYHTLVDKTFIEGLTPQETKEKEGLRLQIGEYNAPIYKAMFDGVNAPTGMGDPGK